MVKFPGESRELSCSGQLWHRVERLEHIVGLEYLGAALLLSNLAMLIIVVIGRAAYIQRLPSEVAAA